MDELNDKQELRYRANPHNTIEAVWLLLKTRNQFMRAAGILLLKEYVGFLAANGKGDLASKIVEQFRDADRQIKNIPHTDRKHILRP